MTDEEMKRNEQEITVFRVSVIEGSRLVVTDLSAVFDVLGAMEDGDEYTVEKTKMKRCEWKSLRGFNEL